MEAWRRINSNQEKYLRETEIVVPEILSGEGLPVVIKDYTILQMYARSTGLCNWGMLEDRFMPLGFGVAFVQGSPYRKFIDEE